jgi:hypothetical protein
MFYARSTLSVEWRRGKLVSFVSVPIRAISLLGIGMIDSVCMKHAELTGQIIGAAMAETSCPP